MVITDFSGSFSNALNCKEGDIVVIVSGGKIDPKFGNLIIEIENKGKNLKHSPRMKEGQNLQDAFGIDSDKWVGKKCKIMIVNVALNGVVKQQVHLQPIKEK